MNTSIIPVNIKGKQNDLQYSETFSTAGDAVNCFRRASKRLLNPAIWHELCGILSASFKLVSEEGDSVKRLAQVNDYFRIDVPGPGTMTGKGFDWVKVEAIENRVSQVATNDYEDSFGIMVRPCSKPKAQTNAIAHFFESSATSSFIIHRKQNIVTASYHGRNETPNADTGNAVDNIRNTVVATGSVAGLSEAQWYALIKGLLQEEIGG